MNHFYIDKSTNTFADELLTAGFVELLRELLNQQGVPNPHIVQEDQGYAYSLTCEPPLDMAQVTESKRPFFPAVIVQTNKNKAKLPADLPSHALVHYEAERDKRKQFFEARNALKKTSTKAETASEAQAALDALPPPPHPDWDIFRMINPAALIGYNGLMKQWFTIVSAEKQGRIYGELCQFFSQTPNDIDTLRTTWRTIAKEQGWKLTNATASQFYNPSQGKGINKLQPNGVGLGNQKNVWLLEWLKAVGFYKIAFTRTMQGAGDRKTYVPVYGRMTPSFADDVYRDFKQKMIFSETAVRSDILIVLRYLQTFLEKTEQAQAEGEEERELRALLGDEYTPADFMHGFHVAFYKDLGNAVTTMNLSFLNLPGWVHIQQEEDVQVYIEILQEHEQIVRQFTENKGEEIELLQRYRDFIAADHLDPFYEFTTAYSSWLISQGEKSGFPPRKFTTHNIRRLLVSTQPQLSKILESSGFINIAYAIRQSTVVAQYRKAQEDRRYNVRYGLGRDLVRQSQYPDEFIAALSDFLHKYNAENAQVMETRPKPYRKSVKTSDIQDILALIDEYGSDLIAKLLVAYGYAREPRHQEDRKENETQ